MAQSRKTGSASGGPIARLKPVYDLVLAGGHVIDPANNVDGVCDIGIRKGRIAALAPRLEPGPKTKVIDARGLIVTPGLIDTHAHVYEHVSGDFGLNPDLVGIRSGVTTVVDQGGPSALDLRRVPQIHRRDREEPGFGLYLGLSRPAGSWATAMSTSTARPAST